jgi:hypothetical protein
LIKHYNIQLGRTILNPVLPFARAYKLLEQLSLLPAWEAIDRIKCMLTFRNGVFESEVGVVNNAPNRGYIDIHGLTISKPN